MSSAFEDHNLDSQPKMNKYERLKIELQDIWINEILFKEENEVLSNTAI